MTKIKKYKNGVKLITEKIDYLKTAVLSIYVDFGSIYETDEQAGISHFIEHMMFKGTKRRSSKQILNEMDFLGGNFNASTGKETVNVFGKFMGNDLGKTFDLLFDIFLNPTFDQVELDKERGVILEEIMMREDDPDSKAYETFIEKFWLNHPYGRKVIGSKDTVKSFNSNDLLEFYLKNLNPNKITILCVGSFDEEELSNLVEEKFGSLPVVEKCPEVEKPESYSTVTIVDKDIEQIHFVLGSEYENYDPGKRNPAFDLMMIMVGSSWTSRMQMRIREELGYVYSIGTYANTIKDTKVPIVYGSTSRDKIIDAISEMKKILKEIQEELFSEDALENAKQVLKTRILFSLEYPSKRIRILKDMYDNYGEFIEIDEIIESIDKVGLKEIQEECVKSFKSDLSACYVGKIDVDLAGKIRKETVLD